MDSNQLKNVEKPITHVVSQSLITGGHSKTDHSAPLNGYDHGAYREMYDGDEGDSQLRSYYGFGGPNIKRAFTLEDEDMGEVAPPMAGRRFYGGSALSSSMGYANRQQTMYGMGGGMGAYPGYTGYGGYGGYPGMYGRYPGYSGYGGMGYPGYGSGYGMGGYPGMGMGMGGISPYMGGMGGMGSYGSSSSSSSGYQNSQSSNYGSMFRRNSGNAPCEGQACDEQKRRTNEVTADSKDCDEKECKEVAMDENPKRRLEPIPNSMNQQPLKDNNQMLPFLNPQPPPGKPEALPPARRRSSTPEEDEEEKRRSSGTPQTMIQIPMTEVKLAFVLPPKLAGAMPM